MDVVVFLRSDSTITLLWIAGSPRRWKTYVANRVAIIQQLTTKESWRHVAGTDNPADLASRGVDVTEIIQSEFWWQGPSWMSQYELPAFPITGAVPTENIEERSTSVKVNAVIVENCTLQRFSSLNKLKRCTAYYLRFLLFKIGKKMKNGPLTALELDSAMLFWILKVQQQHFGPDLQTLKKDGKVGAKSKIKTLFPFVDNLGVMRVSGRLGNAALSENTKHQCILPADSHLTTLIVRHYHFNSFHGGFQLTWSAIQSVYWVVSGREKVRHFVRSCVRCRRYRGKIAQQLMADLPLPRVTPSRCFMHTCVDYAGPFLFKNVVGRAPKTYKGYLCLFVCLSTKAIHLEAVSSLSTEAFIATLRRFVSRRGLCGHLYSDCGTNFVGAEKELKKLIWDRHHLREVEHHLGDSGITWHFNPPGAPHRGGLWEAGVKSAKHHLRRVIGNSTLTFEQFNTVICQIKAVLNSRPLYRRSTDPFDFEPLTPGHFLVGESLIAVPDVKLTDIPTNRLSLH